MKLSMLCLVAVVAPCLTAGAAFAEPSAEAKDSARELGREGTHRFVAGQYERAQALFHRAYELVPAPTLAVREGNAADRLGRLLAARRAYEKALSTPIDSSSSPAYLHAVAEAKVEIKKIDARIPHLVFTPQPLDPGWTIEVNDEVIAPGDLAQPRAVDPGPYRVRASASGKELAAVAGWVREGETRSVLLEDRASGAMRTAPSATTSLSASSSTTRVSAPPATTSPSKPGSSGRLDGMRIGAVVAAAGGVALITVGAATGVMALSRHDDLTRACVDSRCPPSARSDLDAFHDLRTVSTVAYVAGGLGLGAGVALWLLAPSATKAPRGAAGAFVPVISLGAVGVRGTF